MSTFEEYINRLDGQENLDPSKIVADLLGLHTQEIGTREAKIQELNDGIAQRDTSISEREAEITRWKAKNFDLAMQVPTNDPAPKRVEDGEKPDPSQIRIGDLFTSDVRKRHGL